MKERSGSGSGSLMFVISAKRDDRDDASTRKMEGRSGRGLVVLWLLALRRGMI